MTDEETNTPAEDPDPAKGSDSSESSAREVRTGRIFIVVALLIFIAIVGGGVVMFRSSAPKAPAADTPQAPAQPAKPLPAGTTGVPDVVGVEQDSAFVAIEDAGFVPLATFVATSTGAPGSVVAQVPSAGTGLEKGSQVSIAVARAADALANAPVPVPNVYPMQRAQAQSLLMSAGFSPVFAELPSVEATGVAVAQLPTSEGTAVPGDTVLVLLSTGQEPKPASIAIPSVVGMTEAEATKALEKAQLGFQVLRGFNSAFKDSVFAQLPPAGGQVAPQTPIALAVSLGPLPEGAKDIVVPDVTKLDAAAANKALADAGFLVQQASVTSPELPSGKVAGQLPLGGWRVPAGSIVIISIAK